MKFCTAKRTHVTLGCAKFHLNWCNESPLRGENADFRPVSKFKYQLTSLRGVLPVNYQQISVETRRRELVESHHVVVECGGIGVDERNEFFHRPIERLQQPPHLSVKVMKLLVAVRQKANHRAQCRPLAYSDETDSSDHRLANRPNKQLCIFGQNSRPQVIFHYSTFGTFYAGYHPSASLVDWSFVCVS